MGRFPGRFRERQRDDALGRLDASGLMREGRVLSRSSPSKPSSIKRSCQRQTQVLDFPVRLMIAFVRRVGGRQHDFSRKRASAGRCDLERRI